MKKRMTLKGNVILITFLILISGTIIPIYPFIYNNDTTNNLSKFSIINEFLQNYKKKTTSLKSKQKNPPTNK